MSREIITLQFGHSTNFVGTHFWNIQESCFHNNDVEDSESQLNTQIDHDVLFREGRNIFRQVTFTPRLILYDLKGSLKTLPETGGSLYAEEEGEVIWNSDVTLHKEQVSEKNEFLRECEAEIEDAGGSQTQDEKELDETDRRRTTESAGASAGELDTEIEVWSDFLGTQLHPRSLNIVKDYYHATASDGETAFDLFAQGWDLLGRSSSEMREELEEDKVRFFAEECDYLQGFQLHCDAHNGFSGMACGASEYLQDEYHGRSVLSLPMSPLSLFSVGESSTTRYRKIMNYAMCLGSLGQSTSAVCPLSLSHRPWTNEAITSDFSWINFDADLEYHSSAILAAALDSLTIGCRMKVPNHSFSMYSSLADCGQKLLTLDVSLPFPLSSAPDSSLYTVFRKYNTAELFSSLNPFLLNMKSECMKDQTNAAYISLRGIPESRSVSLQERKKYNLSASLASCEDFLVAFADEQFGRPFQVCTSEHRLPLRRPFPRFFSDGVLSTGDVIDSGIRPKSPSNRGHPLPSDLAVASCLRATGEIGQSLQELRRLVEKVPMKTCLPPAAGDVMEMDDMKNIVEGFYQLCDNY